MEPKEAEGPGGHSHNPKVQEGCGTHGVVLWVLGQPGQGQLRSWDKLGSGSQMKAVLDASWLPFLPPQGPTQCWHYTPPAHLPTPVPGQAVIFAHLW